MDGFTSITFPPGLQSHRAQSRRTVFSPGHCFSGAAHYLRVTMGLRVLPGPIPADSPSCCLSGRFPGLQPCLSPSFMSPQGLMLHLAHGRCLPIVDKSLKISANVGVNEARCCAGFVTAKPASGSLTTVPLAFLGLGGPLESHGRSPVCERPAEQALNVAASPAPCRPPSTSLRVSLTRFPGFGPSDDRPCGFLLFTLPLPHLRFPQFL